MCLNLCQHQQLCEMSWKIWAYCLLEDIPVPCICITHRYRQSWLPVYESAWFRADSRLTFCTFILYYTASKGKKWQMWHLRCCQVTVQSWGKLDFDWLLVRNKIDLLAVTDDDERAVAEVDICGFWRSLGFLVLFCSYILFCLLSSLCTSCSPVLLLSLFPSPTPASHQPHQHRLVRSVSPPALYYSSFVFLSQCCSVCSRPPVPFLFLLSCACFPVMSVPCAPNLFFMFIWFILGFVLPDVGHRLIIWLFISNLPASPCAFFCLPSFCSKWDSFD